MNIPEIYVQLAAKYEWIPPEEGVPGPPIGIQPVSDWGLVYPPIGFMPFVFGDVGNGDLYGYYWPIGREDADPIIAMSSHDVWALNPVASSIEKLAALGHPDTRRLLGYSPEEVEEPLDIQARFSIDPNSPFLLVATADQEVGAGNLDVAQLRYEAAIAAMPEYTAAHYGLATIHRRRRKKCEAIGSMLDAVRCPMAFRGASFWADEYLPTDHVGRNDWRRKCLHWLRSSTISDAGNFADDPMFRRREKWTFQTGVSRNDDIPLYEEAIDEYLNQGKGVQAAQLAVVYAEALHAEATPFRERYGYTPARYRSRLDDLFHRAGLEKRRSFLGLGNAEF